MLGEPQEEEKTEKVGLLDQPADHSANLRGSGSSAKNLAENPKELAEFYLQDLQLFGCMSPHQYQ